MAMFEGWPISWYLAGVAALLGTLLGLLSFLRPSWGASVVRLRPDPDKPGGFSEFRATYGLAFALVHASVLLTLAMSFQAGAGAVMGASFAAALFLIGMSIGRGISVLADAAHGTRTGYNIFSVGFELVLGLMLLAPFLGHLG